MFNNYNPYYQQPRYSQPMSPTQVSEQPQYVQPMQPFIKLTSLQGKQVDSVDVVKATDVPFDGSVSYFPLTDGSAIVTKQLQSDGTSKITIYEPKTQKDDIKFATIEDIDKKLEKLDFSEIDDLKEEINDLKKELKELKNKLKTKKED